MGHYNVKVGQQEAYEYIANMDWELGMQGVIDLLNSITTIL